MFPYGNALNVIVSMFLMLVSCSITLKAQDVDLDNLADKVCEAAISIEDSSIIYDASYVRIPYPGGDVAPDRGVCTDVVVRALRKVGLDLQVLVAKYEREVLHKTNVDTNIDHRRCPNLKSFFDWFSKEHGYKVRTSEPLTKGSIIFFKYDGRLYHVGIYVGNGKFIHNKMTGQRIERMSQIDIEQIAYVYTLRR